MYIETVQLLQDSLPYSAFYIAFLFQFSTRIIPIFIAKNLGKILIAEKANKVNTCYNITMYMKSLVQSLSHVWLGLQHTRLPLHYLPECTQTSVHLAGDAIQPSHPVFPASPPALTLSQHQGLFQ